MQPREPVPVCSLSQGTQPLISPLPSPDMISLRPELGVLNQLLSVTEIILELDDS